MNACTRWYYTTRWFGMSTVLTLFLGVANTGPLSAIDIQLMYTTEGNEPVWDPNGDVLMAHARAAEAIWERLLPGSSNTYELWIEWDLDVPAGVRAQWNPV